MPEIPFMPKATAVWLVENTTLTFKQIADFVIYMNWRLKALLTGMSLKVLKHIILF